MLFTNNLRAKYCMKLFLPFMNLYYRNKNPNPANRLKFVLVQPGVLHQEKAQHVLFPQIVRIQGVVQEQMNRDGLILEDGKLILGMTSIVSLNDYNKPVVLDCICKFYRHRPACTCRHSH